MNYLLVFLGGGVGAVCRYLVTTAVGTRFGLNFPLGTFAVNIFGSFLMGFIMGMLLFTAKEWGQIVSEKIRLLLTVGFLGGFTTFSSFSLETLTLIEGGSNFLAIMNVLLSVMLGLLSAWLGVSLARII